MPKLNALCRTVLNACYLLLLLLTLGSCGGESPSLEPSVQARNFFYGVNATFTLGVSRLTEGLSVQVQSCESNQAPVASSSTELSYECTVKAAGDTKLEVIDQNGKLVYSKLFTVPAPSVRIESSEGSFDIELNPNKAPVSVDNFLRYVQNGFYTDLIFHRVIPGFVVQTGGFTSGMVQRQALFASISLESNRGLSNKRASVAMARTSDPDSANAQFFVNLVDNAFLDYSSEASPGYAVFGEVVRGMEVIDAIAAKPTASQAGFSDVPTSDVVIKSAIRIR
jgi:peptidyl-prolyl cis-trans isomerase A (cyclophilin A)